MIIYLTAIMIFMTQCFTMCFVYFDKQKKFKRELNDAYHEKTDVNKFFYFILIPCLNEGKVIKDTLQHAVALDGQKQIIVIDDDSIDDTLIKAHQVKGPISIIQRILPEARTGKGDSLNSAMPLIQKTIRDKKLDPKYCIVGVLDADGVLSQNSIYKLNDIFDDQTTDAVQLRVKMKAPKNILQTFQDIEFFVVDHLIQVFRSNLNAVAFCGNGQFFRYSTVTDKLGLQPWGNALLEDYELTIRMELKGLRIKYLADAYVDQEALLSVKKLINQRARWAQGGLNCWKYFKQIVKSKQMSRSQKADTYFFFFEPILNLLADFSIIYLTINFILKYSNNVEFLFVSMLALAVLGLFFGAVFTLIYLRELKLNDHANVVIDESDMVNERIHLGKDLASIGLVSYIYIILFFSLIISAYHEITGQNSWDKTKRI